MLAPAVAALLASAYQQAGTKTKTMKKVILVGGVGAVISFLMFFLTALIVSNLPVSHI